MFARVSGAGAPAIVFVHGFACDHTDWDAQAAAAAPSHRTVACDLRGHGETPGTAAECTIETFGGDVAALLEAHAPAVVVGHSMGCRVALEAYRRSPARVAGLVLVDGSRMGEGDPVQAAEAMRAAIEFVGFPAFAEALFAQMFFRPSTHAVRIVGRARRLPGEIGAALFPAMVRWDAAHMDRVLASVRVPLLVIQSTTIDANRRRVPLAAGQTTPWLELVRAHVATARVEIVPGVGHFPQIEAPERVNALLAGFAGALD